MSIRSLDVSNDHASKAPLLEFHDVVMLAGDKLVTDSRKVASGFGKRHDSVLRDIHAMRDNDEAEIREHCLLNFEETVETRPSPLGGVIPSVAYRMTKDGFAELAMSCTGNKARIIRIRFLAASDAMAEYIARREQTLWQQMVELNAQDAASEARASFDSNLMLERRKALPEFEARRLRALEPDAVAAGPRSVSARSMNPPFHSTRNSGAPSAWSMKAELRRRGTEC
ncbi:hypothetical protein A7U58_08445 [Burkholderia pseudomallei]|nr:hypothetical protein A7U58_08445 [Burkholderia pseudomallei]